MGLNQFNCIEAFGNTGIGRCALIPSYIVGMIIVPNNFLITEANSVNLQTFMDDAAKNPSKPNRIFPIHNFVGLTDNSEDVVTESLGYGYTVPIRDGNYSWTFRFIQGGVCLLKALQSYNGSNVTVLFYDSNGVVYGRNTANGLMGVPLISFFAGKWTLTDSTTVATFAVTVTFEPKYLNQDLGFIKDEAFTASDVIGLQDVNINAVGAQTATILSVSATAACGGENLFDLYSDELADGALWDVRNGSTGAALTVTSVAANAVNKTFTITLSAARTNATIVGLAGTDVLEAAGIMGIESKPVVIPLA